MNEGCLTAWPKLNFIAPGWYARVLLPYSQEIIGEEWRGMGIPVSLTADRMDMASTNVRNDRLRP